MKNYFFIAEFSHESFANDIFKQLISLIIFLQLRGVFLLIHQILQKKSLLGFISALAQQAVRLAIASNQSIKQ